jgi:hypothetical protein
VIGAARLGRVVVATAAVVVLAAAPAAATGPTGDGRSITLFRLAARTTDALPAADVTQSGYVRIADSLGPVKQAHWAWGWAQYKAGYRPATEHLVLVQRRGRTLWLEDTMVPVAAQCSGTKCAQVLTIQLLITRTAAFYGLVSSGTTAPCFTRVALSRVPYVAGTPWWAVFGDLAPAIQEGTQTEITSRYASDGQAVTEADWIGVRSHRFAKTTVRAARGDGHRPYAYLDVDTLPRVAPRLPALTICS